MPEAYFVAALAAEVASLTGETWEEVREHLLTLPLNHLVLLHSPQGWSALAAYAASSFGREHVLFQPTVH